MTWNYEYKRTVANPLAAELVEHENAGRLPLSEAERRRILYEWNNTSAEFPRACVHELFERRVEQNPAATALLFQGRKVSYGDLNERANRIAHYLCKLGAGAEQLIGICLDRSPEMVAGLLGIWKAGAAYLPLDPAYPQERLSFMVRDADARVLLTETRWKHLFSSTKARIVCVDEDWPLIAQEEGCNPSSQTTPENLAYVMYTSGSTGTPKGAMIEHRGLVNYLMWAMRAYGVEEGCSVPVHSSISFDLTVTSLYTPLLAGGHVELLAEDAAAQNLLAALRRSKGRALVKITPAHLELLSQQLSPQEAEGATKAFVIGGENLLAEKLRLWRESAPETRLINEYGPTETVVGCSVYEVKREDPLSGSVPIGCPIANTELYVLDSDLQPVPVGETGELFIGGAGVGRGYWNRPELTAERFVPDPFSGRPQARLYRSGDLARYRQDGVLEYLGRVDDQVKVRGYRIELGEIETALSAHRGVKSSVVMAREDESGTRELVGYVSAAGGAMVSTEQLQAFLKKKLPEYMVPGQFVFLESFPLTPNGKIDRKALPAPSYASAAAGNRFVAPRTEIEKKLAAIWTQLLKVDRIGLHDDFFDLGAHSLMAVRAMSQIRDALGVELPLATLLEAPNIAALAKLLGDKEWAPSWSLLVPMRPEGSRPPFFLFHAHGGNVLEYHALVQHMESDQPVYAFQAKGLNGEPVGETSVEEMAAAFLQELTQFQPQGPYFLGGFCLGGLLALEAAQQLTAAGHEVGLVVMIQSMTADAARFRPSASLMRRGWYRSAKRLSLEAENFSHEGRRYLLNRILGGWERSIARAQIAADSFTGRHSTKERNPSSLYVFEALGIAHKAALEKYQAQPYRGETLVFRASKQLAGLMADASLGWGRLLQGKSDICEIAGHQQNLLLEPNVRRLAKELSARLRASQDNYTAPTFALPIPGSKTA